MDYKMKAECLSKISICASLISSDAKNLTTDMGSEEHRRCLINDLASLQYWMECLFSRQELYDIQEAKLEFSDTIKRCNGGK